MTGIDYGVIDYGVIAIKNNELLPETKYNLNTLTKHKYAYNQVTQGAAGNFGLTDLGLHFYKCFIDSNKFNGDCEIVDYDNIVNFADMESFVRGQSKRVLYWTYNNVDYKTKRIGEYVYLTSFKFKNDFYHIISGYDIDLRTCYSHNTAKIIIKYLKRFTGKTVSIKIANTSIIK